jgi:hypothetical protein
MTVFNLYCHSNPEVWQEIDERWNYCLLGRKRNEVYVRPDGYIENRQATPIYVVHGNASTLPSIRGFGRVRQLLASRRRAAH